MLVCHHTTMSVILTAVLSMCPRTPRCHHQLLRFLSSSLHKAITDQHILTLCQIADAISTHTPTAQQQQHTNAGVEKRTRKVPRIWTRDASEAPSIYVHASLLPCPDVMSSMPLFPVSRSGSLLVSSRMQVFHCVCRAHATTPCAICANAVHRGDNHTNTRKHDTVATDTSTGDKETGVAESDMAGHHRIM